MSLKRLISKKKKEAHHASFFLCRRINWKIFDLGPKARVLGQFSADENKGRGG